MKQSTVRKIFNDVFNGQGNFMTPTPVKYGSIGDSMVYEVSSGRGLSQETIYGLTFLHRSSSGTWVREGFGEGQGGCFRSLLEVEERLDAIREYYFESLVS